jgi:dimethylhistidine N-methyltransferase
MPFRVVHRLRVDPAAEKSALLAGLRSSPARIPPKFFYDALGCALYGAICELPEYYPTRTERAIFAANRIQIADAVGRGCQFVDLGAGDCCKARGWLPFIGARRYVAVDIAADAIGNALARMAPDFPQVEMLGVVTDFAQGLDLAADLDGGPVAFFYPGSSIGNFDPPAALDFLRSVRWHCASRPGSSLLIGVDTKKDRRRLAAAYDDALGVTAAFNRNVLNHVNRLLGSAFRPAAFLHRGFYNPGPGRIEMHLEAASDQLVDLAGTPRRYAAGERIHTENSYKYAPAEFRAMLEQAGFAAVQTWQDPDGDFAVMHARGS